MEQVDKTLRYRFASRSWLQKNAISRRKCLGGLDPRKQNWIVPSGEHEDIATRDSLDFAPNAPKPNRLAEKSDAFGSQNRWSPAANEFQRGAKRNQLAGEGFDRIDALWRLAKANQFVAIYGDFLPNRRNDSTTTAVP